MTTHRHPSSSDETTTTLLSSTVPPLYTDTFCTLTSNRTLIITHYSLLLQPLAIPLSTILSLSPANGGTSFPSGSYSPPINWYATKIWGMGIGKIWWAWNWKRVEWGLVPKRKGRENDFVCKVEGKVLDVGFSTVDRERFWKAVTEGWEGGEEERTGLLSRERGMDGERILCRDDH